MTSEERAVKLFDRMDAWAAKDIPSEEWKSWVKEELSREFQSIADEARALWMGRIKIIEDRGRMPETNCATIHDAVDAYREKHPTAYPDLDWLDTAIAIIAKAKGESA